MVGGSYSGLGDFSRDFILIFRRNVGRGEVFSDSFNSVDSWNWRFLFNDNFRWFYFKLRLVVSLKNFLFEIDFAKKGIYFTLYLLSGNLLF